MKYLKWIEKNTVSLQGKTVAMSGATGGIGVEVCNYLAYLGADLICLDRNADKSNKLIENLKIKFPKLNAKHISVDLEDFDRVVNVTNQLKKLNIDYLILNAGAYKIPRHKCSTGFDNVFQINFVSPYYIARELMPYIKERGGRVIAVSSIAHNYSIIDVNDIDFSSRTASSKVYGNAKRYLTFALYGLFDNNTTLSIVHPGITFTNITNHYPKLIFALIKHPMKIIFINRQKAALNLILGLFNGTKHNEWIGPNLFNVWGFPKKKKLITCSEQEANLIYKITENIFDNIEEKKQ